MSECEKVQTVEEGSAKKQFHAPEIISCIKSEFDIPLILPLVFWTFLMGTLIDRTRLLVSMFRASRFFDSSLDFIIFSAGKFLLNFATIMSFALIVYYFVNLSSLVLKNRVAISLTLISGIVGCCAIILTLIGLIFSQSIISFLTAEILTLVSATIITLTFIVYFRKVKKVLALLMVLCVVSFVFFLINHLYFFFPGYMVYFKWVNLKDVSALGGEVFLLVFSIICVLLLVKWARAKKQSIFIPFLISISVLFTLLVSVLSSKSGGMVFSRILHLQYFQKLFLVIHSAVVSLLTFSFSLLVCSKTEKFDERRVNLQTGFALGFCFIITFSPSTTGEVTFVLLSVLLWLSSGFASPYLSPFSSLEKDAGEQKLIGGG